MSGRETVSQKGFLCPILGNMAAICLRPSTGEGEQTEKIQPQGLCQCLTEGCPQGLCSECWSVLGASTP